MKKVAYDDYYKEQDYFGNPYPGLIEFFSNDEPRGTILDLGCGQGRDALSLGGLGYRVIGVDHSSVGIAQLTRSAEERSLDVEGIVGDIYSFPIPNEVAFVLLDSILHFYKNDLEKETAFIERILEELRDGGVFVNCLLKGAAREKTLKAIVKESPYEWEVLADTYIKYSEANAEYHLFALKKRSA